MAGFDAGTATHLPANPFLQVGEATFARPSLSPMHEFLDELEEGEPFLLFLAPKLPHIPLDPPADLISLYTGRGLVNPAILYYANITRLDEVIGQIIETLEARGLRDDSLIIYVSDNGWEQAPDRLHFLGGILGGNRGKLSIYEMGLRTPLLFNWPGHVSEGRVLDDLVQFEDLHATILGYAGAPIPPDHDGVDLGPRIEGWGEKARDVVIGVQDHLRVRQEEWVPGSGLAGSTRIEEAGFLRTDEWRYIEWVDRGEQALYRIEEDPFERNDVSADHPELTIPAPWMDLMGRLTSEEGAPAVGLRLWLEPFEDSESDASWEILSDDRGYFRFPNVPAGEFTLSYEIEAPPVANGRRPWRDESTTESRLVDLTNYQTAPFLHIQIPGEAPAAPPRSARPGMLEIELTPRGDAETRALPIRVVGWTRRGRIQQRALSGPDGFVAFDQLPTGVYRVRASGSGGAHLPSRWVHLRPGETRLLHIDVRESPGWRGKRRNAHHAPWSGSWAAPTSLALDVAERAQCSSVELAQRGPFGSS
jgi:hypothetical protein